MDLQIISYPHPTLRYRSKPVKRVDRALRDVAARMLEMMYHSGGVGLAANQVDIPLRLFVCNPSGNRDEGEELVLVNPVLGRPKGSESAEEGCLSIPGVFGPVMRPKQVHVSAFDLQGNAIDRVIDGFTARVIQHEFDHLEGVLFFDRMTPAGRGQLEGALEELELDFRSRQHTGNLPEDEELLAGALEWERRYG